MRFIVTVEMDTEAANAAVRSGTLGQTIHSILEDLQPEAAYFIASHGSRTAILVVNLDDPSQVPALAEPWFLAFNAKVDIKPAMVPEDLAKAHDAIGAAASQYG